MLPGSRLYLAVERHEVRGGYAASCGGWRICVCRFLRGVVNRSYARVGPLLVRSAEKTEPLLYALGMGGLDRPLPRMLQAMGWSINPVALLFSSSACSAVAASH